MCDIMEKLMEEQSRNDRIDLARFAITKGKLSNAEVAEYYNLPLSTIEELAEAQKKPL